MKHLDITFDFETCSTAPDAAPMQLAAVAWSRRVKDNPFLEDTFCVGVDLRTCVVAGFSFDQDTIDFWSRQNNTAKSCVLADEPLPVNDAFRKFFDWVDDVKKKYEAETVCLWCQGQDFDFPILKTIARKFFMTMPIHQHYFRDCRTFVLETALLVTDGENAKRLPDYIRPSGSHDDILRKPIGGDAQRLHEFLHQNLADCGGCNCLIIHLKPPADKPFRFPCQQNSES